ncbi:MAG: hypothetical protein WD872_03530 [Pirellulaceae bacterium]
MKTVFHAGILGLTVLAVGLMTDSTDAQQRPGRGGRGGAPGGFGGQPGGGVTGLLQDENVRKELDLVDEQVTKLREIGDKLQEESRGQFDFGALRELSEDERNARLAEMREKTQKLSEAAQREINEVLLPHQRERLNQIQVQSQMRFGADRALASGTLAENLGITDEQKEKLEAKQREVQAALQEQIEKLRAESQNELFSVLSPEQQAKLKQMIGAPFTFSQPAFGGGLGGRGGEGGRGDREGGERGRGERPGRPDRE